MKDFILGALLGGIGGLLGGVAMMAYHDEKYGYGWYKMPEPVKKSGKKDGNSNINEMIKNAPKMSMDELEKCCEKQPIGF